MNFADGIESPCTYRGRCHVNLKEAYVEYKDDLTETMHVEASELSGILMGKPMIIRLIHSSAKK